MSGNIVYSNGCPHCGGMLDNTPGFSGKCPYCGQIVGHDASQCPCETCQMYRDAQMGLELLDQLKRKKAKRLADGIREKRPAPQMGVVRVISSEGHIIQTRRICSVCGSGNSPISAEVCEDCGNPFE